jgi:methylated-DNA-[protein]-cysteine S-methyltransferase
MVVWTEFEGRLTDGLSMRVFLAERGGQLWASTVWDEVNPKSSEKWVERLGAESQRGSSPTLDDAVDQMKEYFAGTRRDFVLRFDWRGTSFQKKVWEQLTRIPYAQVKTYGDIAVALGSPGASRAIGQANGSNNLGLLVPCHRVVAAGGKIGGYTGGLGLKQRLLKHERSVEKSGGVGQGELDF